VSKLYLTDEHIEIAKNNGICKSTLRTRVYLYDWGIQEAITKKPMKPFERKGYKHFTKDQVERAKKKGITYQQLYRRCVAGKWPVEKFIESVN
jgi:hypothetical protein